MKNLLILMLCLMAGCAGIPDSTLNALATSGGGCATSTGLWGTLTVMSVGSDKGVIHNGSVNVQGKCDGITFTDAATVRTPAAKP